MHIKVSEEYEIPKGAYVTRVLNSIVDKKKLHGLSPRANYTDRATAACRRRFKSRPIARISGTFVFFLCFSSASERLQA
jgi:hypothetical protein